MRYTRRKNTKNKSKNKSKKQKDSVYIGGTADSPCIIVDLASNAGLGNQLFIYSAGLVAKNKTGLPMCILPAKGKFHSATNYRELLFKQGSPVEEADMQSRLNRATKVHENIKNNPHGKWSNKNLPTNKMHNIAMKGVFYQNYESIKSAIPQIRNDLTEVFKNRYPTFEEEAFKGTSRDVTMFMHVRKGDYGDKSLPTEYYQKAIGIINGISKIKTLYIVSDDVNYCKSQVDSKIWTPTAEVRWLNPEDAKDELKTLYLMSMCSGGAILSGSTFSCWGAFLGADGIEDSIIIYPTKWYTGDSKLLSFPEPVGNKWISI